VYKKRVKRDKFKIDRSDKGKEKRTFQGIVFDSEMELKFYRDVVLPQKESGIIKSFILQPKYVLQKSYVKNGKKVLPITYVSDYEIEYSDGRVETVDVKGLPTETAKIKLKLFDFVFPDKVLRWIALSAKFGGWIDYFELQKLRAKDKKNSKSDE